MLCQQVHIEFTEGEERITLEGPTKDVQMVQSQIEVIVADLVSSPNTFTIVLMFFHYKCHKFKWHAEVSACRFNANY